MVNFKNALLQNGEIPFSLFSVDYLIEAAEELMPMLLACVQRVSKIKNPKLNVINEANYFLNKQQRLLNILSTFIHTGIPLTFTDEQKIKLQVLELPKTYVEELNQIFKNFKESDHFDEIPAHEQRFVIGILEQNHWGNLLESHTELRACSAKLSALYQAFQDNTTSILEKEGVLWTDNLNEVFNDKTLTKLKKASKEKGADGYFLTPLDLKDILTYAKNPELRKRSYYAIQDILSDNANKYNNSAIIDEIILLRKKFATLMGYHNYAEMKFHYSRAVKNVETATELLSILRELYQKSCDKILNIMKKEYPDLNPWDIYYEQHSYLENERIAFQEYFPLEKVISGLFKLSEMLFNLRIKEVEHLEKWHEDVRGFHILDENNEYLATFYLDLYVRPNKYSDAYYRPFYERVGAIFCSFARGDLLDFKNIMTLFHEFGHLLSDLLNKTDTSSYNIEWDLIEVPSKLVEKWLFSEEIIPLISEHYQTKEPIPKDDFNSIVFMHSLFGCIDKVTELHRFLFDLVLNSSEPRENIANEIFTQLAEEINPPYLLNHPNVIEYGIIDNNYLAGAYSYLLSDYIAQEIWQKFKEKNVFDKELGMKLRQSIFEKGASEPFIHLVRDFLDKPDFLTKVMKD